MCSRDLAEQTLGCSLGMVPSVLVDAVGVHSLPLAEKAVLWKVCPVNGDFLLDRVRTCLGLSGPATKTQSFRYVLQFEQVGLSLSQRS